MSVDGPADVPSGSLDPALLAILVCPLTRAPLRYDPVAEELISDAAQLAYPVRAGVPVLVIEEARYTA
ncbi:Trm112 family protein [Sphingomonas profundi]|uniref:Trm112 family protein n=1 Tax=Alterirhizorhabdus profundi TaxID=2681549 RepID=UPI0012E73752|nr:Trm112 family protein [Sphingomonas profundi]